MKRLVSITLAVLLSGVLSSYSQAQSVNPGIKVSIIPEEIYENGSFNLIFQATERVDDSPDFSPLEKDFTIVSQVQRNNFDIFHGEFERSDNWVVELVPDRAGDIVIPSVAFGKDLSPSIKITIKPADQNKAANQNNFLSELEVSSEQVHVKSQIIVTKRLLSTHRIARPSFSDLKVSGVEVILERLNEGKSFTLQRGDTTYNVLESHYALYPQQAGTIRLEPNIAVAQVAAGNDANINPLMNNAITKRAASQPVNIMVKPVPSPFTATDWLPSSDVQLTEEWSEKAGSYKAGEPITRTLSITVKGQGFAKIPPFPVSSIEHLKHYPDNPIRDDKISIEGITGTITTRAVLIPTQGGEYILPAIEMPWWNTRTNTRVVARIPERRMTVEDSAGVVVSQSEDQSSAPPASTDMEALQTRAENARTYLWLSIFLAMGWGSTLLFWFDMSRARKRRLASQEVQKPDNLYAVGKALKAACDSGQAQSCEEALLIWGCVLFADDKIRNLGMLGKYVGEPLASEIRKLETALYSNAEGDWDAEKIWQYSLNEDGHYAKASGPEQQLEPMYK